MHSPLFCPSRVQKLWREITHLFCIKKWAQEINLISPDLLRDDIRTGTNGSALPVLLYVLISKQNEYKILADYIFFQGTRIGGIRLIIPTCIPVLSELVKWIVLLQTQLQNLWGFKIRHAAKEMRFSPCAVWNLGVFHTVQLWCNSWARKECRQQHIFMLKSETKISRFCCRS